MLPSKCLTSHSILFLGISSRRHRWSCACNIVPRKLHREGEWLRAAFWGSKSGCHAWCSEDDILRRAKACVGSEIQGILSTVTSHKGRQQPELLTPGHLGSNTGSEESVSGFSSKVCSGQPNSRLPALPSKVYSITPWPHQLETQTSTRVWGHILHSGCNVLSERLVCRQNDVPLIYTLELCSPERVPPFAGSLKVPHLVWICP